MKRLFWLLLGIFLAIRVGAQSNATVCLALVVESPRISTAGDFLAAELSKNPRIILLERSEIERVYREQGLSAANNDYLKLGRVLGADGLWLGDDQDGKVDRFEFYAMAGRMDDYGLASFNKVVAKSEAGRLEIYFRKDLKDTIVSPAPRGQRFVPPPPTFKERVEIFRSKQNISQTAKKA